LKIESREPGEGFTYTEIAKKYGVSRVTLARRHKGKQATRAAAGVNRMKLSPEEELELVDYIKILTKRSIAPTREMIQNFASGIAGEPVGEGWVTRFIYRNHDHLVSQ
jgi:hypothetical protein